MTPCPVMCAPVESTLSQTFGAPMMAVLSARATRLRPLSHSLSSGPRRPCVPLTNVQNAVASRLAGARLPPWRTSRVRVILAPCRWIAPRAAEEEALRLE